MGGAGEREAEGVPAVALGGMAAWSCASFASTSRRAQAVARHMPAEAVAAGTRCSSCAVSGIGGCRAENQTLHKGRARAVAVVVATEAHCLLEQRTAFSG